jgi:hypothetical protein
MSAPEADHYRVTLVGQARSEIRELAKLAGKLGRKRDYLDAWSEISNRLSDNPIGFGECRFHLLHRQLRCHIGVLKPVAVWFSIHPDSKNVFVLKIYLLGS